MNWKDTPLAMLPHDAQPVPLKLYGMDVFISAGIPKDMIYLVSSLETVALNTRTGKITTIKDSNTPNP